MHRLRICLDTQSDVREFVNIANTFPEDTSVLLEDGTHFVANAKSMMGVMYGKLEFKELFVMSEDKDVLKKFDTFRCE